MARFSDKSRIVLVVDDEPLLRLHAVDVFEQAGCRTLQAAGAAEALAQLDAHPEITVLFTDIQMPGAMDGLGLARRLSERRPDIKVIITSCRIAPRSQDMPLRSRFISKPYDSGSIARMIRDLPVSGADSGPAQAEDRGELLG